jgi:hypothetical protein
MGEVAEQNKGYDLSTKEAKGQKKGEMERPL